MKTSGFIWCCVIGTILLQDSAIGDECSKTRTGVKFGLSTLPVYGDTCSYIGKSVGLIPVIPSWTEYLRLDKNELEDGMFNISVLETLQNSTVDYFQAEDNKLTTIPFVPRLKSINLNSNILTSLDLAYLAHFTQLQYLQLENNLIKTILGTNGLTIFASLKKILLRQNKLTSFDLAVFENATNLDQLILENNLLTEIKGKVENNKKLTHIKLKTNYGLTSLDLTSFSAATIPSNVIRYLYINYGSINDVYCSENCSLNNIYYINMEYQKLTVLDLNVWISSRTREVRFNRNKINSVVKLQENAVGSSYKSIYIEFNKLTSLNLSHFENLSGWVRLYLQYNQITQIFPSEKPFKLLLLDLTYNKLTCADFSIFEKFYGIVSTLTLKTSYNEITSLACPNSSVPLKYVYLNKNKLTEINFSCFQNFPSMVSLYLGYNAITMLNESSTALSQLSSLYLNYNKLTYVNLQWFVNMPSIYRIDLSYNKIVDMVPATPVFNMPKLRYFYLSSNLITSANISFFEPMPVLESIYLQSCLISLVIPNSNTIIPQNSISRIYMNTNKLTHVDMNWFQNFTVLQYLYLYKNLITYIVPSTTDLPSLTLVNIYENNLSQLDFNWFINMPILQDITAYNNDLSILTKSQNPMTKIWVLLIYSNKFTFVNMSVFDNMPILEKIDLRSNLITALSPEFCLDRFDSISGGFKLYLDSNPLHCNETTKWLKTCTHSITYLKTNQPKCATPSRLSGKAINTLSASDFDTNECESSPCQNEATCMDLIFAYNCSCVGGFTGVHCETDIDECTSNPCLNGGNCTDMVNKFSCECMPGYTGARCETDIDECSSNPCHNNGTCSDAVNYYTCSCQNGFTGIHCETEIDECTSSPCKHDGTCLDQLAMYSCTCSAGYTGHSCETDINECNSNPCAHNGTCSDRVNGYDCTCAAGYTGTHCVTDINECSSDPCANNGTCSDKVNGYDCTCAAGYTGTHCMIDINECSSNPCAHNGTCSDRVNGYDCTCAAGYTGTHCVTDINECGSNPCANNGTCSDRVNGYECICVAGYTETHCRTDINECGSSPCAHNGTCSDRVNGYDCTCAAGYTGIHCVIDINECRSNPCAHNGTCSDRVNGYDCICAAGYTGTHCVTDVDECASNPCRQNGTCTDRVNGYICSCIPGYAGADCQTEKQWLSLQQQVQMLVESLSNLNVASESNRLLVLIELIVEVHNISTQLQQFQNSSLHQMMTIQDTLSLTAKIIQQLYKYINYSVDTVPKTTTNKEVKTIISTALEVIQMLANTLLTRYDLADPGYTLDMKPFMLHIDRMTSSQLANSTVESQYGSVRFNVKESSLTDCFDIVILFAELNPFIWDQSSDNVTSSAIRVDIKPCGNTSAKFNEEEVFDIKTNLNITLEVDVVIHKQPEEYQVNVSSSSTVRHYMILQDSPKTPACVSVIPTSNQILDLYIGFNENTDKVNFHQHIGNINPKISLCVPYETLAANNAIGFYAVIANNGTQNCSSDSSCNTGNMTYKYSMFRPQCHVRNSVYENWMHENCQVMPSSTSKQVRFKSNLMGSLGAGLFVAPNTINFLTVFNNLGQKIVDNAAVIGTVAGILVLYLILAIFFRRLDNKDTVKWKVYQVADNDQNDKHLYEIHVFTGFKRNSGTESKVSIVLSGTDTDTGVRTLYTPERKNFKLGEVSSFLIRTPFAIGTPTLLKLWHDGSGKGNKLNWFLSKVVIVDIATRQWYVFVCETWIPNKGGNTVTLHALTNSEETHSFLNNFAHSFYNYHMWLSIAYHKICSPFTRVQRLNCCLTTLYLLIVCSAMWYGTNSDAPTQVAFTLGIISVTTHQIYTSFMTTAITMPIVVCIIMLYDNIEQTSPILRNHVAKNIRNTLKKKGGLPHWCVYLAHVIVFCAVVGASFFTILYAFEWGKEKSEDWLGTLILCVFENIIFISPFMVICMALLYSFILKADFSLVDFHNLFGKMKMGTIYVKEKLTKWEKYEQKQKSLHKQMIEIFRGVSIQIVIVILVMCIVNSNQDRNVFLQNENMKAIFLQDISKMAYQLTIVKPNSSEDIHNMKELDVGSKHELIVLRLKRVNLYNGISTISTPGASIKSAICRQCFVNKVLDTWEWMSNLFIPNLYLRHFYNGEAVSTYDRKFIINGYSMRFGPPNIRLIRISPDATCHSVMNISRCLQDYSVSNVDKSNYLPGWKIQTVLNYNNTDDVTKSFLYKQLLHDSWFWGKETSYAPGGYIANLGTSYSQAKLILTKLEDHHWLDRSSRMLMIKFNVWNANTNLFNEIIIVFEFLSTGLVQKTIEINSIQLYRYVGAKGLGNLLVEVITTFAILIKTILTIKDIGVQRRRYFSSLNNIATVVVLIFYNLAVGVYIWRSILTVQTIEFMMNNKGSIVDFYQLTVTNQVFLTLLGIAAFVLQLQLLHILRYVTIISTLAETLSRSKQGLLNASICVGIFSMAFITFFLKMYGSSTFEYYSFISTSNSLILGTLGKFRFDSLVEGSGSFGTLMFIIYLILQCSIFLNVLCSVLIDYMAVVNDNRNMKDSEVIVYMKKWLKSIFSSSEEVPEKRNKEVETQLSRLNQRIESLLTIAQLSAEQNARDY